jgi:hypothetical protein
MGDLDPQCDFVITTEIASGRFEDDLRRMRMAAWHGADHIMVIRTTGQSHIDGLLEGTPEGVNGAHQDPQYNVLYRNINMHRSFVDAAEAKRVMSDGGLLQIDGAHNANARAKEAWKVTPELLVQHAIGRDVLRHDLADPALAEPVLEIAEIARPVGARELEEPSEVVARRHCAVLLVLLVLLGAEEVAGRDHTPCRCPSSSTTGAP